MEVISVVIPVYNVECYLKECLDSVIKQTYASKEILLVDDGSSDSSGIICDEYAARYSFIRVIHKENKGLSSARNRGLEEACGDWVIFLDSDDVWADEDGLTKLHQYAAYHNLDVLRFEYQVVNENLECIESRSYDKSNIKERIINNYELVKYGISGEWFAFLFFLRKDALAGSKFNEQMKFQEDIDFYCRFFAGQNFRCGYLDERMYFYRKRRGSITATYRIENLKGSFKLCDIFYAASKKTDDGNLRQLYVYYSIMMYYWTLQTLAAIPYYEHSSSVIEQLKLELLHKRVIVRIIETSIDLKYKLFIYPSPKIGVKLLHFKDKLIALMS